MVTSASCHDACHHFHSHGARLFAQNVLFLSSAGCDLADEKKQPRLREFIELKTLVMFTKDDPSIATGHSPVVIRLV